MSGNNNPPDRLLFDAAIKHYKKHGSVTEAAKFVERPRKTVEAWIRNADYFRGCYKNAMPATTKQSTENILAKLAALLKNQSVHANDIAAKLSVPVTHVRSLIEQLRETGINACRLNGDNEVYSILTTPAPTEPGAHVYKSRAGGYYKFGYLSDNHYCSKYAREDVVIDLYDWFRREGVDRVFNTGNYIDGEARFNKHDIFVHGMQNQVNYFCEKYPSVPGLKTYFVSGDDHEGWYGQREGIDIGWLTERTAVDRYGRKDLVHLGFVESFVKLQHADNADAWSYLLAVHPGGGSAYATSYAPQKYVEALQGGEKPAVILFGHWHKIFDLLIRNVICLGGGCTKDLDPFGRKNKLAYHLGGMIVELWQDDQGAITRWRVEKKQYFDRGYKNNQWAYEGRDLIGKAE